VFFDAGSNVFTAYTGDYAAPTGYKLHYQEDKGNLFVTTSKGIKVFQDVTGTEARSAGAPRGIHISLSTAGAAGFLANNYYVAYRYIIQRTDANNNILIGYPSERRSIQNTAGGARDVTIRCYLAADVIAGDELFLYRTATNSSSDVGDEMKLVYTVVVTSSNVSAGYLDVSDVVIDAIQATGEALYTNSNQEGIAQGNLKPPLAKDLALYKSRFMFYANTEANQQLYTTLVSTSSLNGNTFVLAGLTYTFDNATEDIATRKIKISATGVPAFDIEATALSMVNVINGQSAGTVYAFYMSGDSSLPGQMLIQTRDVSTAAFTITASVITTQFSPQLASAAYNKTTSSKDAKKNGLFYSKANQPEHVPGVNYNLVGPSNTEILRIAPLRDSLIIIKEEGVYRLTGEDPSSFTITPLDLTVRCKARESIAILSNQVFMLSNQGVVMISDTGVEVISGVIEPNITPLLVLPNLDSYSYAIGYESDHTYLLSLPETSTDTTATQTFIYHVFTKTWVRDTYGIKCGIVEDSVDKLFFSKPGNLNIYRERKQYLFDDHADPEYSVTITAIDGYDVTVTISGTSVPLVGDVVRQSSQNVKIVEVNGAGPFVLTLDNPAPTSWTTGAAQIFPGVGAEIRWASWTGGNPDLLKQVRQVDILIDNIPGNSAASSVVATFVTDFQEENEVDLDSQAAGWDTSPWGQFPWGGIKDSFVFPTFVPMNNQYCRTMNAGFRFNNALERIAVAGIGYTFNAISERVSK
jgi:hypothetical protein